MAQFDEIQLWKGLWPTSFVNWGCQVLQKYRCGKGASFEDVVDIRNLSIVYTLAGVDCIDCAADSAVVAAVLEGVATAQRLARHLNAAEGRPWIISDDEDPHFRKAGWGHHRAMLWMWTLRTHMPTGTYPTYVRDLDAVANLLSNYDIDAIEIHTGAGHLEDFHRVVGDLSGVLQSLKLIAVSVPDLGDYMVPTLAAMYESLRPSLKGLNLWQI